MFSLSLPSPDQRPAMGGFDNDSFARAHSHDRSGERNRAEPVFGSARDEAKRLLRAPPSPRDTMLMALAKSWLNALPPAYQPHTLCVQYPRVANRLALCWNDKMLTEAVFDDLLLDRRGGRQGFPGPVHTELVKLRLLLRNVLPTAYRGAPNGTAPATPRPRII